MSESQLLNFWNQLYNGATTSIANLAVGVPQFIILGAGVIAAIGIAVWLISKLHFGRRRGLR